MNRDQIVSLLTKAPFFADLPPGAIGAVAERAQERSYRKGATLFFQGDPGDAFYVLAEGSVKVFVSSGRGEEMVLATVRPPESLGEVSMLDGGPRSACAEALDAVTAIAFPRSDFLDLLAGQPSVADALLRSAGRLLRRVTAHTADLVFLDLEGRVAKLLIDLSEERGETIDDGVSLDLGLTQGDLASMVGGSRQSVNQILHALETRGFISLDGRTVVIVDHDRLAHRAGITT
jgi:CRP/FNR family transcriptional regulator, cyclic AMP receptor protein